MPWLRRVADDAVHGQEIRRVVELGDEGELVGELGRDPLRDAFGVAACGTLPGQSLERLLWREGRVLLLVGILVAQVAKVEAAAFGDLQRARDRVRVAGEQAGHFLGRLEVAVGKALALEAGGLDRAALADAGDDILQDAALGMVEQHVAGGDEGGAVAGAHLREAVEAGGVARPAADRAGKVGAAPGVAGEPVELGGEAFVRLVGQQDEEQALAADGEVVPGEGAAGLAGAALAGRDEAAEARPSGAVGRVGEQRGAAGEVEAGAGDEAHAGFMRRVPGADDAGDAAMVGDAKRGDAVERGLREQLLRMAGATEEAVVAGDLEFGVGHAPGVADSRA